PLRLGQVVTSPELEQEKQAFYRMEYWNAINGDDIPLQELANQAYDQAVNGGDESSEKILNQSKP
ncbi:MAG TPA: glycosyl hydrolase 108 family protein, partial [Puia sp.]|nr:glycosyl hydrolase 108 family protein [Puia sp.]